jgi:NAD-dependent dihydropyrimidine dehydrogenase PreA subunit
MKLLSLIASFFTSITLLAQTCDPGGNVVIYANYDGGILNINVDENIPNLKIGVCTYEDCQINISGAFAGNVSEVIYAGFQGDNDNCNSGVSQTSISGVPAGITEILFAPPATLPDGNGNGSMICAYTCDDGSQGGCNTADQVVDYFLSQFGGTLRSYFTQYNCFSGTYSLSDGLCCGFPVSDPDVTVSASVNDALVCVGQCVDFNATAPEADNFIWSFGGADQDSSTLEDPSGICYTTPGTYSATVTASNNSSSDQTTLIIEVIQCGVPGCTYPNALNYDPEATVDDQSCEFECESNCPGDFNSDGLINTDDLLQFLGVFSTVCPN